MAKHLNSLKIRFAPSQFDDPEGALFKLTQTSTVCEYQCQFETLSNRVTGLPHHFLSHCFISRLKAHIRREVQVVQPISLMPAIDLAKLQEDKYIEMRKFQRNPYQHNTYLANQHTSMRSTSSSQPLLSKSPTSISSQKISI